MAIHQDDIITLELNQRAGFHRSFLNHPIGTNDIKGNIFGVRLTRDGEPVDVTEVSLIGYFMRADGNTVVINGGLAESDGTLRIRLPQSCYAVPGNFTLALKVVGSAATGTIRIIDGTVINTTTGDLIDPGSVVPDLTAVIAKIAECETAAAYAAQMVALINKMGLYIDDEGYVCQKLAGEDA